MWEGLRCSENTLLRSMVQVDPLSAQESNLSVWVGLCCSGRAPCRSLRVLDWLEWTQDIILSVWEGLMLP